MESLILNKQSIKNTEAWTKSSIELPQFDYEKMAAATYENPTWVHFGSGNIFRGFIAVLQQKLLNAGKASTGIIAAEGYDYEIIDRIYTPYDNLSLLVIMNPDGSLEKKIIGSISESLAAEPSREKEWERLKEVFTKPSLQMASFTITEKGYALKNISDEFFPFVKEDIANGPASPKGTMAKVAALAYVRYKAGELPIAFVSMDNCSRNGEKLQNSVVTIAEKWVEGGLVEEGFLSYLQNPEKVSFPWSMIDKITPRPDNSVKENLESTGFESTEIVITKANTYIAPFVNAEGPQYLAIEDKFPNGRMPLELAGVFMTDRETVEKVETMKVTTCLNPLHTALAVFGCTLGFKSIAAEMKDPCLKKLIEKIGYEEGMPVVVNPGILNPKDFIKEVIEVRFPNPYIPDTPQRIASDTSQKVGIRFGETIKSYIKREDLDVKNLKYIPLAIAGWCRYLLGVDDSGNEMQLSPDPLLEVLKGYVSGIKLGDTASASEKLRPILSNSEIFGSDLYKVGLGEKIEGYFAEMFSGAGAVRATLEKYLNC
ncbi:mannitol dehydrogenase family protein [Clostridium swellfunianum]|uniref:mannitol dehydrogenase family protein n=1 Tax=Clostridium swellfunianum TaxID=1367462 RepID=UPI00202F6A3F|nr:mannitol dehydrogenase family protein [Clostridium swellfunianum]MCM0649620.1 mannitol dehydrogenase family protein [Clostridium swellfunianum]